MAKDVVVIVSTEEQQAKLAGIIRGIVHCEKENLTLHLRPDEFRFLGSVVVKKTGEATREVNVEQVDYSQELGQTIFGVEDAASGRELCRGTQKDIDLWCEEHNCEVVNWGRKIQLREGGNNETG